MHLPCGHLAASNFAKLAAIRRASKWKPEAAACHSHHKVMNDRDCDATDQEAKDDGEHGYLYRLSSDLSHLGLCHCGQARHPLDGCQYRVCR
jgi:hypothetical protein